MEKSALSSGASDILSWGDHRHQYRDIWKSRIEHQCPNRRQTITGHAGRNPPSDFPPLKVRPASRALRANGISSSGSNGVVASPSGSGVLERRCDTVRAREHNASESIPASVRRGSRELVVAERNVRRKRTTSSTTSSSHRLSLSPSEARIRISSACTGIVNTRAALGSVLDRGPSCNGVLNFKKMRNWSEKRRAKKNKIETYTPPHLLVAPDNAVPPDKHAHAVAEVRDPNDRVVGTRF